MASEKVFMILGVKDELKKLQQRMARIQKFLEAAERRRLEDPAIKHWVGELKDVAYDVDDIIDRCIIEGAALSPADRPFSSKKLTVCFDFSLLSSCFARVPHRYEIAKSIKALNDKLEDIYKDRLQFKLEESGEQPKLQTITTVNTRQTSPLEDVDVLGSEIEEATKELVTLIVGEQAKKCRVIALTGMGGIGKTTLAQKIYNNKKIQTEFQKKVWVCVSQNYDEVELLQHVIDKGADGAYGDTRNKTELLSKNKAELLPLLQSTYHGKSLFLILDDVWRADVWIDLFRIPLQSAVAFLRILVTTRDDNIASGMGAAHIHPVKLLFDQTGWQILCKKVFLDGVGEEIKKLEDIGFQIVKKCSGLPLAIKVIAGVLAKKEKSRREWEKVLNSDAWSMKNLPEELRGGLYLSYDDLPSNLKQCFVYCSLFPEDKSLDRDDVVRLWVAEGFINEQNDSLVEDVAKEYYNELIKRNLLQPDSFDDSECTMHDLLRSLAKFISQDEIFSGMTMATTTPSSNTKLRRLSIENPESVSIINDLVVEQKCLRTLLTFKGIKVLNDNQLMGLVRLRVLRINNVDIDNIPNSIGDLIHLRYLNLNNTKIRKLPESIGNLFNLQFLYLQYCTFLTMLPKSITMLRNLRCLLLDGTPLISIPKGISKLEKINNLCGFVVTDLCEPEDSYSSLEELLNSLYQLRMLSISRIEKARRGALSLQKLTHLIDLELLYTKAADRPLTTEEDITRIEDALEELCPPQCLERLYIEEFFGVHYPRWMKSPSFGHRLPHLTLLELSKNISCSQLPPVGELPELTHLHIMGATSVKSIGSEFLGAGVWDDSTTTSRIFPNLQILFLHKMPELEEWSFNKEMEGFEHRRGKTHVLPQLKYLAIVDCPKLKALPKGLEQCNFKKLSIADAHSLKAVENLPSVEQMKIDRNRNLERVSNLPALYELAVEECPSMNCVEKLDSLQRLQLSGYNVKGIPKWLERLLKERKPANVDNDFRLTIISDDTTLLRFLKGGPDWPIIVQIPQFIAYNDKRTRVMRYTRNPFTYTYEKQK